jgi:hypothetical protein
LKGYLDQNIQLTKDWYQEQNKASKLFKDLQKTTKEKSMLDGRGNYCMICRENLKNIVYIPCMHVSLCRQCQDEHDLRHCPQCRLDINEARVIYW